jgi:hypothetical protein
MAKKALLLWSRAFRPLQRSGDRKQMTEVGILISGIRNLFSVMSDVLLYALCPLLYALFARNP